MIFFNKSLIERIRFLAVTFSDTYGIYWIFFVAFKRPFFDEMMRIDIETMKQFIATKQK